MLIRNGPGDFIPYPYSHLSVVYRTVPQAAKAVLAGATCAETTKHNNLCFKPKTRTFLAPTSSVRSPPRSSPASPIRIGAAPHAPHTRSRAHIPSLRVGKRPVIREHALTVILFLVADSNRAIIARSLSPKAKKNGSLGRGVQSGFRTHGA